MNKLKTLGNYKKCLANLFLMSNVSYSTEECVEKPKPIMRNPSLKCVHEGPIGMRICDPSCPGLWGPLPKVIIIGAGIAGLSAAMRLISCGFEDVTILEAKDRPGGRILTTWMGDTTVELGPSRIQGASVVNPVYTLACIEGLFKNKSPQVVDDHLNYLMSDGRFLSEHKAQDMVLQQLLHDLRNLLKRTGAAPDISLQHYLSLNTDQILLTLPTNMKYDSERIFYGLKHSLKAEFGTELDNISAFAYASLPKLIGKEIIIPSGFINVLAPLIRNIPAEYIHYDKPIEEIKWSPQCSPRIVVTCVDDERFEADFVIITLPLGVLKEYQICMFDPELPKVKVDAINALGVGYICNIYLDYVAPWWPPDECQIRIAWHKDELNKWAPWLRGISTIKEVPGSKHVISLTIGGEEAKLVESMTHEEIADDFTNFIRTMMHNNTIQFPNNVIKSDWSCDSYFYGAKSYLKVGSTVGHIKDLCEPGMKVCSILDIPPILFAGEHTHPSFFGTIHGARLSGLREANRILEYTKMKQKCGACSQNREQPCPVQKQACA